MTSPNSVEEICQLKHKNDVVAALNESLERKYITKTKDEAYSGFSKTNNEVYRLIVTRHTVVQMNIMIKNKLI